MSEESSGTIIRASELGQYSFCARSWWLEHVQGIPSVNVREMASGIQAHRAHGRSVERYVLLQWLAYGLLFLAVVLGFLALYAWPRGG